MKLFNSNSRSNNRSNIGKQAEKCAATYLKRQGLRLIAANYHSRFGEIDLIMRDEQILTFVEVRCRAENAQVSAAESITPQKMQKIRKTAECYLMRFDEVPECRFDVIAMTHNRHAMNYTIEWIKNAF